MQLRRWQSKAREVVQGIRAQSGDRALIAAAPGTGKTLFTASLLADDFQAGIIDGAVIVGPSRAIKAQWQTALAQMGLKAVADIDNGTLDDRRARGMDLFDPARPINILTYQQVCAYPDLFAAVCARHRVFAVFDEIHHADDQAEFGNSLLIAFEDAVFKLSLSGTPATTKGSRLAFCTCRHDVSPDGKPVNVTVADYEFSYGEALQAGGTDDDPYVVRPMTFIRWNGRARWRYQSLANPEQITDRVFDGSRKSDSLTPLLDPELDSLKKMLRVALDELDEVRRHQSNAGMLITAQDADHCERIADMVRAFGINDVVIVRHDVPGAHKLIRDFDRGTQRVLVAIKMVAEGVDIRRLRVGVYASNVLTWMYFMQFVGRFIRWDPALSAGQFASVFIPEHVVLIEYAKKIEGMVLEAVITTDAEGGDAPSPATSIVIGKEGDGAMGGAIQHGLFYEASETDELKSWMRRAGVSVSITTAQKLWQAVNGRAPTVDAPSQDEPDESKRNDKLVGQIVLHARRKGRGDLTYETVNALANRHIGIPKKDKLTSVALLVQRRQFLQKFLLTLLRGEDDAAAS